VLSDGFAFCARPESNYLSGPDDIYVSPSQSAASACVPRHRRGPDPLPKEGERYFALLKVNTINFEDPEKHATISISTI